MKRLVVVLPADAAGRTSHSDWGEIYSQVVQLFGERGCDVSVITMLNNLGDGGSLRAEKSTLVPGAATRRRKECASRLPQLLRRTCYHAATKVTRLMSSSWAIFVRSEFVAGPGFPAYSPLRSPNAPVVAARANAFHQRTLWPSGLALDLAVLILADDVRKTDVDDDRLCNTISFDAAVP